MADVSKNDLDFDDLDLDLSKKKKKKKTTKVKVEDELDGAGEEAPAVPAAAPAAAAAAPAAPSASESTEAGAAGEASEAAPAGSLIGSDGLPLDTEDLVYDDMLRRLYREIYANNPELTERTRKKLKPPQVSRVGTTRTCWTNFKESCASMKRSLDHVQSYFLAELGTTGSIDGSDRFMIKGKYLAKIIESLLRNYIVEYVTCNMCKSLETELTRDAVSRLYFLHCKACESTRSVAPIKAGYHATAKGERKKARNAAV